MYLDLLGKHLCLDQGNIHIFSGKVTENPNDMDIQMSKHDAFEHRNSARRVRWATIKAGKNQCLNCPEQVKFCARENHSLYLLSFGPNEGQTSKENKSEGSMEADMLRCSFLHG